MEQGKRKITIEDHKRYIRIFHSWLVHENSPLQGLTRMIFNDIFISYQVAEIQLQRLRQNLALLLRMFISLIEETYFTILNDRRSDIFISSPNYSEVSAMLHGLLNHNTDKEIDCNYVDTHGRITVGFVFFPFTRFRNIVRLKTHSVLKTL
ncbi:Tn3 family transposase [Bacillus cereus]|uniref:Tn3 family transposase n=1 Tax=Bacillus cereus TaxID=1396 RepID=UPI0023EEE67A|nr:Tn3 family transposase [Bacillus cereus]